MDKRVKKYLVLGIVAVGALFVWYGLQSPVGTYSRGRIESALARPGQVAGLSIVKLPVPYHRQEHSLSCEAASLTMVLNYLGVPVSESEVINNLPFDRTPKTNQTWGDPSLGFVGNINGKMSVNGYGVYWEPIARVANLWRYSEVIPSATPQTVTRHLSENRPIIMWGYFGHGQKIGWQTPTGKQIQAVNGEHVRVITGFIGSAENPEGFILLDPIYGELYWDTNQLMANWSAFNYSGVVVY